TSGRPPLMLVHAAVHRAEVASTQGEHVWNRLFGQAMDSDQTKSRRIQAFDGRRSGLPTGLDFSNVMPSVPSSLTEDTAGQEMHDDWVSGTPAFSASMMELPRSIGSSKSVCTPSSL